MKVLTIPHAPQVNIRTRTMELSKALARSGNKVDVYSRNTQGYNVSFTNKIKWHIQEISSGFKYTEISQNLRQIKVPTLHKINNAVKLVDWYSANTLQNSGYEVIISSAYSGLFFNSLKKTLLIYDLVDDHADGCRSAGDFSVADKVDSFISSQIEAADIVIASSKVLVELAEEKYGRKALYIPNGANVKSIRNLCERKERKTSKKIRIGYVGGLDEFVRIDIVASAVQELRKSGIDAELIVVGDGPAVKSMESNEWLHLLGFKIPEEIPAILQTLDIGVVPFTLSPFTDAALPLKVIEYGAARCFTLSSPIKELQIQQFPWVEIVPLEVESWVKALEKISTIAWESNWDSIVDDFDWDTIADRLTDAIEVIYSSQKN